MRCLLGAAARLIGGHRLLVLPVGESLRLHPFRFTDVAGRNSANRLNLSPAACSHNNYSATQQTAHYTHPGTYICLWHKVCSRLCNALPGSITDCKSIGAFEGKNTFV